MNTAFLLVKKQQCLILQNDEIVTIPFKDENGINPKFKTLLEDRPDIDYWLTDGNANPFELNGIANLDNKPVLSPDEWDLLNFKSFLAPERILQAFYLIDLNRNVELSYPEYAVPDLLRNHFKTSRMNPIAGEVLYPIDLPQFLLWFFSQKIGVPNGDDFESIEMNLSSLEKSQYNLNLFEWIEFDNELFQSFSNVSKYQNLNKYAIKENQKDKGVKKGDLTIGRTFFDLMLKEVKEKPNVRITVHRYKNVTDGRALLQETISPYTILSLSHLYHCKQLFNRLEDVKEGRGKFQYCLLRDALTLFYELSENKPKRFNLKEVVYEQELDSHIFGSEGKLVEAEARKQSSSNFGVRARR